MTSLTHRVYCRHLHWSNTEKKVSETEASAQNVLDIGGLAERSTEGEVEREKTRD